MTGVGVGGAGAALFATAARARVAPFVAMSNLATATASGSS